MSGNEKDQQPSNELSENTSLENETIHIEEPETEDSSQINEKPQKELPSDSITENAEDAITLSIDETLTRKKESRMSRKKKKKPNTHWLLFSAFFITLLVLFSAHSHINKTTQDNTILMQLSVNDIIHTINIYRETENPNHLISLNGELNALRVLIEQTEELSNTFNLPFLPDRQENKLYNSVVINNFYLESSLKGDILFNPSHLYNFENTLKEINLNSLEKPFTVYTDYIGTSNLILTK